MNNTSSVGHVFKGPVWSASTVLRILDFRRQTEMVESKRAPLSAWKVMIRTPDGEMTVGQAVLGHNNP